MSTSNKISRYIFRLYNIHYFNIYNNDGLRYLINIFT